MNFAVNAATWATLTTLPLFNGGSLVMYSGTMPATPETALALNTALCTFVFSTPAFSTPAFTSPNVASTASFVANSVTPGANGIVTFARAQLKSTAWVASTVYNTLNTIVTNGGNYYVLTKTGTAAASGGPSGTTNAIADNTCQWAYYAAATGQNVDLGDFTIGTSGADIIIGNTNVTTTVNVTLTSLVLNAQAS